MISRYLFPILIVVFSQSAASMQACQNHFVRHLNSGEFTQLVNLSLVAQSVKSATVMVQFELASDYTTVPYLEELMAPAKGLVIPEELQVISRKTSQVIFVAHATSEGLSTLWQRIWKSPHVTKAGFRLIDYALTRPPLVFPHEGIPLEEKSDLADVDQNIKNKMSARDKAFAVYNIGDDQLIFFLPRAQVEDGFDSVVLRRERLKASAIPRTPVSWSNWLLKRSADLDKKTILYIGDWAVVSSSAYKRLYELDRLNSADLPPVDTDFTVALSSCFGFSCAIEAIASPPAPVAVPAAPVASAVPETAQAPAEREPIDLGAVRLILQVLRENRGTIGVTKPGGLKDSFLHLEKFVALAGPDAVAGYREDIGKVGFLDSDYNGIFHPSPAQGRFARAWRAFIVRASLRFNNRILSERWVRGSINALPSDI